MYLSQLLLNPRAHDVQRDVRDAYELHKTLSRAWHDADDYAQARVLFRVEEDRGASPIVLVQSQIAPDWAQLPGKYLQRVQSKQWQPQFADGQRLAFRLRANPTIKRNGKRRGIYHEIGQLQWLARKAQNGGFALPLTEALDDDRPISVPLVCLNSLGEAMREKRSGQRDAQFSRLRTAIAQHDKARDKPVGEKVIGSGLTRLHEGKPVLHQALFCEVQFEGMLYVTNVPLFLKTLQDGIGSAKGLGFGLLSLARA